MLEGILKVLLLYTGQFLIRFGYGREGLEIREQLEGKKDESPLPGYGLGFGVLLWICALFGLFSVKSAADRTLLLVLLLLSGGDYGLWVLLTRKTYRDKVELIRRRTPFVYLKDQLPSQILIHCESAMYDRHLLENYLAGCVSDGRLSRYQADILLEGYSAAAGGGQTSGNPGGTVFAASREEKNTKGKPYPSTSPVGYLPWEKPEPMTEHPGKAQTKSAPENKQHHSLQSVVQETYTNLKLYVRDTDLTPEIAGKYKPGLVFREQAAVDASARIGGLTGRHRYMILSNHMTDYTRNGGNGALWQCHSAPQGSRFKVLGVHIANGKMAIVLLHLPFGENWKQLQDIWIESDRTLMADCASHFRACTQMPPVPELVSEEWKTRCAFPLGLDTGGNFWKLT